MPNSEYLVQVEHLKEYFPVRTGFAKTTPLKAVDNVSFAIRPGETLGLVGESGCGKTTVGRTLLQLYKPTGGRILFDGKVIYDSGEQYDENGKLKVDANGKPVLGKKVQVDMLPYRKQMQMVFQDPYSSLNPRMTVGQIIGEGPITHKFFTKNDEQIQDYVMQVMDNCGLAPYMIHRYPHQFSGGQRQRIGIARSLAMKPKFVVCDEAVSALDVSIQSQVINLLEDLKEKENLTYLFISHDLSVVKYISDRIGVMYLGNMVELCESQEMFDHPLHPYTEALLLAIPTTDVENRKQSIPLEGDIPSPIRPPKGCKFHTRCKYCTEECEMVTPEFRELRPGHFVACHHPLDHAVIE